MIRSSPSSPVFFAAQAVGPQMQASLGTLVSRIKRFIHRGLFCLPPPTAAETKAFLFSAPNSWLRMVGTEPLFFPPPPHRAREHGDHFRSPSSGFWFPEEKQRSLTLALLPFFFSSPPADIARSGGCFCAFAASPPPPLRPVRKGRGGLG